MPHIRRVYLAGPSVFFPDSRQVEAALKALCAEYGMEGVYPLDGTLDIESMTPAQAGQAIGEANYAHIRSCDLVLADLRPYHGPSADIGTGLECAYAYALSKPVAGFMDPFPKDGTYTNPNFATRVRTYMGLPADATHDHIGNTIESFNLYDNCMLAVACSHGIHQTIHEALNALRG